MKTLLLSKEDVMGMLNMQLSLEAVEEAYLIYGKQRLEQPPIVSIEVPEYNGEMDIKSCYAKDNDIISIKTASGYFDNVKNHGLPTMLASIMLLDGKTGYPICIMDGSLITAYRTGAAGGLSARVLARKEATKVAIIGSGTQARMQLLAINEVLKIDQVTVWSLDMESAQAYKKEIDMILSADVTCYSQVSEAVREADIIVTTTPSKSPILKNEWIKEGAHIIAVGADMAGKQELESGIFKRAKIYVDSKAQCIERGETRSAIVSQDILESDIYAELWEVLEGHKNNRSDDNQITLFDTTGMGIQDNTLAEKLYKKAIEEGIGTFIDLF